MADPHGFSFTLVYTLPMEDLEADLSIFSALGRIACVYSWPFWLRAASASRSDFVSAVALYNDNAVRSYQDVWVFA